MKQLKNCVTIGFGVRHGMVEPKEYISSIMI